METKSSDKLQELNDMQLRISYLFKDLLQERNDYKEKSESLNRKLEQLYGETQNLRNEAETLKDQNEILRLRNENMKNVIDRGIKIFQSLDFSRKNLSREQITELETLQTIFLDYSSKIGSTQVSHELIKKEKEENEAWQSDIEIKEEFEGLNSFHFCTEFFCDEEPHKNSPKKDSLLKKSHSVSILKTVSQNTPERVKKPKQPTSVSESETSDSELVRAKFSSNVFRPSPEKLQTEARLRSPVFKDVGIRRNDSVSSEDNSNTSSTSLPTKLINEKFLERSNEFLISPWKKSPVQGKDLRKSPVTPKRVKRQLKINSPDRSPLLKKSNAREAEISISGVRKLRQTFLNIDCYKKKNLENRENENVGHGDEDKSNTEDDDIITESPKKVEQVLEDIKNKKSGKELNDAPFITPPQSSVDADLDETYISSSFIRKCNQKKKHELERVVEEQTPLKRPAVEKSPEYDSVPFVYKRDPVRKKADRMKLPGHACAECNKYYENAFEDIKSQDLRKILNKCSRHRDKNSPTLDDTPPGRKSRKIEQKWCENPKVEYDPYIFPALNLSSYDPDEECEIRRRRSHYEDTGSHS